MPKSVNRAGAASADWFRLQMVGQRKAALEIRGTIGVPQELREYGIDAAGTMGELEAELKALGDVGEIDLYIYSLGGSVFTALALHNVLSRHPAKITAYVDGIAASAATIVIAAADEIVVPENAYLMIHNPSVGGWGDYREMEAVTKRLRQWTDDCALLYAGEILKRYPDRDDDAVLDDVRAKMDAETWLLGPQAVELGLADRTSDAVALAACADAGLLEDYRNVPTDLRAAIDRGVGCESNAKNRDLIMSKNPNPAAGSGALAPTASAAPSAGTVTAELKPEASAAPAAPVAPAANASADAGAGVPAVPPQAPAAVQGDAQGDPASVASQAEPAAPSPVASADLVDAVKAAVSAEVKPLMERIQQLENGAQMAAAGVKPNAFGGSAVASAASGESPEEEVDFKSVRPESLIAMGRKKLFPGAA